MRSFSVFCSFSSTVWRIWSSWAWLSFCMFSSWPCTVARMAFSAAVFCSEKVRNCWLMAVVWASAQVFILLLTWAALSTRLARPSLMRSVFTAPRAMASRWVTSSATASVSRAGSRRFCRSKSTISSTRQTAVSTSAAMMRYRSIPSPPYSMRSARALTHFPVSVSISKTAHSIFPAPPPEA